MKRLCVRMFVLFVALAAGCGTAVQGVRADSGSNDSQALSSDNEPAARQPDGTQTGAAVPSAEGHDLGEFQLPTPLPPLSAVGDVVERVPGGVIDWGMQVVRVTGSGVADPGITDQGEARLMAERAAVVVCQRNLLEITKKVRVDSDARVESFMTRHEAVNSHVDWLVKNVHQLRSARWDSATGTATVEMGLALSGPQSVIEALAPALQGPPGAEVGAQVTPDVQEFFRQYSGLVLVAQDAGLKPALFPKVYDENGNLLLDTRDYFGHAGPAVQRFVQYVGQLDQILGRPEFAQQPLVVKFKRLRGKLSSDIVIGRGEVDKLKWLKDGGRFLLESGRLLVRPSP